MKQDLLLPILSRWKFCTAAHNYSCYLEKPVPSYPHSFLQAGRMVSEKIRYGRLFLIAQIWGKRKKSINSILKTLGKEYFTFCSEWDGGKDIFVTLGDTIACRRNIFSLSASALSSQPADGIWIGSRGSLPVLWISRSADYYTSGFNIFWRGLVYMNVPFVHIQMNCKSKAVNNLENSSWEK